jgi:hypothetical protein
MPKIRIAEEKSNSFFLDKAGRVRRGRPPRDRFCDGCGANLGVHAGHVCLACWTDCKTFRAALREWLGLDPIKGDGDGYEPVAQRFQTFGAGS